MKRFLSVVFGLILSFLIVGCDSNNTTYIFEAQGIEVSLFTDASLNISFEDTEPTSIIAVFDSESNEYKGAISVFLSDDDLSLDALCDLHLLMDGDMEKTTINKSLMFVDMYSTFPASGNPNNWHFFILKDKETKAILLGKFSAHSNDRDTVLKLAKSIRLKKTKKESPYPSDYSQIKPKISILSSNEEVTEYCTILKSWKNEKYDLPPYQELLKDKKVYLLSGYADNIVFADGEHKSATVNAKTDFSESSLFYEGTRGFRISRLTDAGGKEFYVFVSAEYGNSGELTYVFKCKFQ